MNENQDQENTQRNWKDYIPLIVVITLSGLAATAIQFGSVLTASLHDGMHDFMGVFLLLFALFKIINVSGFADGFSMYDLLASRCRSYGLIYPFLELGLALAYLSRTSLTATYTATIVLMLFGAIGVFNSLRKGLKINCACMGTVLNVPLSTVAVVENLGMASMAAFMLLLAL